MPALYTHYRMGNDVIKILPENIRRKILSHRDIFNIGLLGPDIFFFYHPAVPNRVNLIGYGMHRKSPERFFGHAKNVILGMKTEEDCAAAYAYICGFICHYVLDRGCHRYIFMKMKTFPAEHSQLETALERLLLEIDGRDPFSADVTSDIYPTPESSRIISRFFRGISPRAVRKAVCGQIFFRNAVNIRPLHRRLAADVLFLFTGNFPYMHHLLMPRRQDHRLDGCCRDMLGIYSGGVRASADMIVRYTDFLAGRKELRGFCGRFDGKIW